MWKWQLISDIFETVLDTINEVTEVILEGLWDEEEARLSREYEERHKQEHEARQRRHLDAFMRRVNAEQDAQLEALMRAVQDWKPPNQKPTERVLWQKEGF